MKYFFSSGKQTILQHKLLIQNQHGKDPNTISDALHTDATIPPASAASHRFLLVQKFVENEIGLRGAHITYALLSDFIV